MRYAKSIVICQPVTVKKEMGWGKTLLYKIIIIDFNTVERKLGIKLQLAFIIYHGLLYSAFK